MKDPNSKKPTIVLILSFVLAAIIMFWGIIFNYGTIEVSSDQTSFNIEISNKNEKCTEQKCSLKLKPKTYNLKVTSDGFTSFSQDIKLERGDKLKFDYNPLPLPILQSIGQLKEYQTAYLSETERGQLVYLKTKDQGDIQVSTFKTPLVEPNLRVSPNQDYIIIWDSATFPAQLFLIDVPQRAKKNLELPDQDLLTDLKFLSSQELLLETKDSVLLYNLDSHESQYFPIEKVNHLAVLNDNQSILISAQSLDEFELDSTDALSLGDLLDTTNNGGELSTEVKKTYKLFYYFKEEATFTQLFELADKFKVPFEFARVEVDNQLELVLKSNGNYNLIQLGL